MLQVADARAKAANTSLSRRFEEDAQLMRGSIGRNSDAESALQDDLGL